MSYRTHLAYYAIVPIVLLIDLLDYVTCPLPPWRDMGYIGTLTDWPADKAPQDRSWSMKCLVHRGKCAIVRTRRRVSEDMMLRWLFKARIPPVGASRADMDALVDEHKKAWDLVENGDLT